LYHKKVLIKFFRVDKQRNATRIERGQREGRERQFMQFSGQEQKPRKFLIKFCASIMVQQWTELCMLLMGHIRLDAESEKVNHDKKDPKENINFHYKIKENIINSSQPADGADSGVLPEGVRNKLSPF